MGPLYGSGFYFPAQFLITSQITNLQYWYRSSATCLARLIEYEWDYGFYLRSQCRFIWKGLYKGLSVQYYYNEGSILYLLGWMCPSAWDI